MSDLNGFVNRNPNLKRKSAEDSRAFASVIKLIMPNFLSSLQGRGMKVCQNKCNWPTLLITKADRFALRKKKKKLMRTDNGFLRFAQAEL